MKQGYIYKITNDLNNNVYVGQSCIDLDIWFNTLCFSSCANLDINKEIKTLGWNHYSITPLLICDIDQLDKRLVDYLYLQNGYDMTAKGSPNGEQIYFPEPNILFDSEKDLIKCFQNYTNLSEHFLERLIKLAANNIIPFFGCTWQNWKNGERTEEILIELWIKKLLLIYNSYAFFCLNLNRSFDSAAALAKYCLDNGYYIGNSRRPLEELVNEINYRVRFGEIKKEIIRDLKFILIPSVQLTDDKAIYCPELGQDFKNCDECAKFLIDNKLIKGMKSKVLKSHILDVAKGYFDNYNGYNFKYREE